MADPVRILVVGVGNMGQSHAKAYHKLDGFEIAGLMSRTIRQSRDKLAPELQGYPVFTIFLALVLIGLLVTIVQRFLAAYAELQPR